MMTFYGDSTKVSISYKDLYNDVTIGSTILIDDGLIELKVTKIENKNIYCKVINSGRVSNNKGVNIPNLKLNLPSLTEKDISDIKFGIENGFDTIAASFVRKVDDVLAIRKILEENNATHIKIISKIENREGIDNFDDILNVSDGIMVARGDLGVEIPLQEVPVIQKQFIRKTIRAGKIVITATQMLESMINSTRPTRAEVSDIANAVFDGTSCIMLSSETTIGKYPIECVKVMSDIATSVEDSINYWDKFKNSNYDLKIGYSEFVLNYAKCTTAMYIDAKAMFIYTQTGDTPRMIASFLPNCPIFAITNVESTYHQLSMCWGMYPILLDNTDLTVEDSLNKAVKLAKQNHLLKIGDFIILSAGSASPYIIDPNKENRMIGGVVEV